MNHAPVAVWKSRHGGDGDAEIDTVTVDQHAGARAATEHLLEHGHKTVWHVGGPQDWFEARHRLAGWQTALELAGAEVPRPLYGDWSHNLDSQPAAFSPVCLT